MNTSEAQYEDSGERPRNFTQADLLNRLIAKIIDFIIVLALYELIPRIGYFAGITYLLIADGLFQGRSAGKRLVALKVIVRDSTGLNGVCGFKESIMRNCLFAVGYILFGILSAIPFIGWLVAYVVIIAILLFEGLVILGSEDGMRLGDELAKTRVIEDRQRGVNV